MTKDEMTMEILAAKKSANIGWEDIADKAGLAPVFVTSACLGMNSMPAENAAIANNSHPAKWTYENIDRMRKQAQRFGAEPLHAEAVGVDRLDRDRLVAERQLAHGDRRGAVAGGDGPRLERRAGHEHLARETHAGVRRLPALEQLGRGHAAARLDDDVPAVGRHEPGEEPDGEEHGEEDVSRGAVRSARRRLHGLIHQWKVSMSWPFSRTSTARR